MSLAESRTFEPVHAVASGRPVLAWDSRCVIMSPICPGGLRLADSSGLCSILKQEAGIMYVILLSSLDTARDNCLLTEATGVTPKIRRRRSVTKPWCFVATPCV